MLTLELFKHYILSRRAGALVRTVAWICVMGVGVGVMALIVVMSVMNGFNGSLKNRMLAVEPHLVVNMPGANDYDSVETHSVTAFLKAKPDLQTRLFETQEVMLRTDDGNFGGGIARGTDPENLRTILREIKKAMNQKKRANAALEIEPIQTPLEEDGPRNPLDLVLGPGEILMGVGLAERLGIFSGNRITVISPEALLLPAGEKPEFEQVVVKGLLVTNIAEIDSTMIYYDRRTTLTHLRDSASREVGLEVRLPDPDNYDALKAENVRQGAKVTTWIDRNSTLFFALKMEKIGIGLVLGLAALISSFSIVTVLLLLLTQKRKDIGLLMAMGLSPSRTRRVFIGLGMTLAMMGMGGGLFAGLLVCLGINYFPLDILPDIYYESSLRANVDWRLVLGIVFAAGIISILSAYFPAKRETNLSPAEALRFRIKE